MCVYVRVYVYVRVRATACEFEHVRSSTSKQVGGERGEGEGGRESARVREGEIV